MHTTLARRYLLVAYAIRVEAPTGTYFWPNNSNEQNSESDDPLDTVCGRETGCNGTVRTEVRAPRDGAGFLAAPALTVFGPALSNSCGSSQFDGMGPPKKDFGGWDFAALETASESDMEDGPASLLTGCCN